MKKILITVPGTNEKIEVPFEDDIFYFTQLTFLLEVWDDTVQAKKETIKPLIENLKSLEGYEDFLKSFNIAYDRRKELLEKVKQLLPIMKNKYEKI